MTRTKKLIELKKEQRRAYCFNLLKMLHELKPDRLQWCEHPNKEVIEMLAHREFIAELIEVEFKKKKTTFSLCLAEALCDIERTKGQAVSVAVVKNNNNSRKDFFERIFKTIENAI